MNKMPYHFIIPLIASIIVFLGLLWLMRGNYYKYTSGLDKELSELYLGAQEYNLITVMREDFYKVIEHASRNGISPITSVHQMISDWPGVRGVVWRGILPDSYSSSSVKIDVIRQKSNNNGGVTDIEFVRNLETSIPNTGEYAYRASVNDFKEGWHTFISVTCQSETVACSAVIPITL